ncbi:NAD(P)H-dependent oxidoreductase [Alteribacillus sp. HJP-4]|uniref:NAD(P)H-dependent oxidoreductase n=1 Tax=Alteribacillus sp. HJP-4 TaxID=2775394 RepID=UPI0035CD34F6
MKILVIIVHPNIEQSRVNKARKHELETDNSVTIHELYKRYPNEEINVEEEQELLKTHNRIIFQFPMYWYSSPPLLKKWFDFVLTKGWAYGRNGNKLKDKEFGLAVSTFSPEDHYKNSGLNNHTIEELTFPFETTVNKIKGIYLPIFVRHGVGNMRYDDLKKDALEYKNYITRKYINGKKSKFS